ncbi:ARM repeat-containing protein, partial [Aspergillus sclerotiicarbonarius CBS 121057]
MPAIRFDVSVGTTELALLVTLFLFLSPFKVLLFFVTFTLIHALLSGNLAELQPLLAKMEQKAAELVAILKNANLAIDAKVTFLNGVKSDIKQKNVPENAVPSIFEALQLSIGSQHSALLSAGFSTLGHFLKRLFIQEQHQLVALQGRHLYSLLLERLGDPKERIRAQAAQAFTDLWPAAGRDVETYVLGMGLTHRNHRTKETSMIWLANVSLLPHPMTKNHGLLFRSYVPSLVACLEDADNAVRNTAKSTVVELFQNAPAHAKSDLRKQMSEFNVRKSIASFILANIGMESDESEHVSRPVSRMTDRPVSRTNQRPPSRTSQRPVSRTSQRPPSRVDSTDTVIRRLVRPVSPQKPTASVAPPKPTFGAIPQDDEQVEPLIVSSSEEIDDIVEDMLPYFKGRETEDNWMRRERSVLTLRRLLYGNARDDYPDELKEDIKLILDGIFKAVNSLRTTLGTNGCLLVQDIARKFGPKIDSIMMEIIMQHLIKLCAGMKKIIAQNGNATVDIVIRNVSYTHRILQHVASASEDKNVQLRLYSAGWFRTLITKQAKTKASIEHCGGVELIEKGLRKGLSDANPGVREEMRRTFWTFHSVWPTRAQTIMSDLDLKSRSLLEKDPANPNIEHANTDVPSNSSITPHKPPRSVAALKEAIAATKKRYLAPQQALPPRPESSSHVSSLSSAPMRPAGK